jgi:hypothetical protein
LRNREMERQKGGETERRSDRGTHKQILRDKHKERVTIRRRDLSFNVQ